MMIAWAVQLAHWFPIVLHVGWLRSLLVSGCIAKLREQGERDAQQIQRAAGRLPRYEVATDVLRQLRTACAFALGRCASPWLTTGLPNLGVVLLEGPGGSAMLQQQLALQLAAEFGLRVVVYNRERSHVARWLNLRFGDGSGGGRPAMSLSRAVLSIFSPAALDALVLEAAFALAASAETPTLLVLSDVHTLVRQPDVWAHLEAQLARLHGRHLPIVVLGLTLEDARRPEPNAAVPRARLPTRVIDESEESTSLYGVGDADLGAPPAEPEPPRQADVDARAGAAGAGRGSLRAFASAIALQPPDGVRRAAWLAQLRRDELALRADARIDELSKLCERQGLPVDVRALETGMGRERKGGDGARAAIGGEEEMLHVLAWAVGDYLLDKQPRPCSARGAADDDSRPDAAPPEGARSGGNLASPDSKQRIELAAAPAADGAECGAECGAERAQCAAQSTALVEAGGLPAAQPQPQQPRLRLDERHLLAGVRGAKEGMRAHARPSLAVLASDRFEAALLPSVVAASELTVGWDDIATLEAAKLALREVVSLPLSRPELFLRGNLTMPTKGVLLFGPPGTGKTMLAKAVARDASAHFLQVTMSTVTSKWFGESNKYVRAVFTLAAKLAPVVIFIDEVDALLSARSKDENQSLREMKTELMLHWDGLRTREGEQTVVLAATNRPFDLDEAVLRRLPRRILVPLPDQAARAQILRLILRDEALQAGFPLEQLAARTDGYSGSDLKALCVRAAHEPIRELLRAEAVVEASGAPAVEPGVGGAALRPVQFSDFVREDGSELVIASSVSKQSTTLDELLRWNEQYGETRGDAPNQQLSYYT